MKWEKEHLAGLLARIERNSKLGKYDEFYRVVVLVVTAVSVVAMARCVAECFTK